MCVALAIACYPLRGHRRLLIALVPIFIVFVIAVYWFWGAGIAQHDHYAAQNKQQQIKEVLASIRSPDELIEKLKNRLQQEPSNPKGWYVLGRVYATQGKWKDAERSFATALELNPDDEQVTVNYGQAAWQSNQQKFDDKIRNVFLHVLKKNPNQPDALAMLAMDAFMRHDYPKSIEYWQHLLKLVPPDSTDAQTIRKAIAKAQQHKQA